MKYLVYILRDSFDKLYIGHTNNLNRRILEHNSKNSKAAKFTKDHDNFRLDYKEEFSSLKNVVEREKQLKSWSRAKKEALIKGQYEKLKQLSKSHQNNPKP